MSDFTLAKHKDSLIDALGTKSVWVSKSGTPYLWLHRVWDQKWRSA